MRIELYTKGMQLPTLIEGALMHSADIFHLIEQESDAQPFLFVAYEQEQETGHLLVVKRRRLKLFPPGVHTWYCIYGEGVYSPQCTNREEIFALFLDELFKIFDFRHTLIEIRNLPDSRFAYETLSKREFFPRRTLRIYNSLHSRNPQERLSRAYRAHIRNAEKRGVTYCRATTQQETEEALQLLVNYYATKIRRNFPKKNIIRTLLSRSHRMALFCVKYKGKIIGCSVCIYEGDRAFLAYSCGLRKRHPLLFPGIMAIWAAMSDAHRRGYSHFEFLESNMLSSSRSGFINLILNFGGKQVSTLRWSHFKWGWINKICRAIYV